MNEPSVEERLERALDIAAQTMSDLMQAHREIRRLEADNEQLRHALHLVETELLD